MDDAIETAVRRITDAELAAASTSQDPSPVAGVDLFALDDDDVGGRDYNRSRNRDVADVTPAHIGNSRIRPFPVLEGVRKQRAATRIGLERGQSSFTVDPLHRDWGEEQNVPREDGAEWPEDFEGEGGYYEGKWRTEEEARRKVLEAHPDYQFLTLVAGHANAVVEQLYEEGDVAAIVRRQQALLMQQRVAIEEVRTTARELTEVVRSLEVERQRLREQRDQMRVLLVETDRQIQELDFWSTEYEQERDIQRIVSLKRRVLTSFNTIQVLTVETLTPIKDAMLEAARRELEPERLQTGPEKELRDALRGARDQVRDEVEGALVTLANTLIDLWIFQADLELYARLSTAESPGTIRREFASAQTTGDAPIESDLQEAVARTDTAKLELLRRFYDVLFFLSTNNILTIQTADIYTARPLAIAPQEQLVPKPFEPQQAEGLYIKYGGTLLGEARPGGSEPFRSTQFRAVFRELTERSGKDPDLRERLERPIRAGPFIDEMKYYREWLSPQLEEVTEDVERIEAQLEKSRERLARLRTGEVRFEDIEQPYRHRRQWVEMPEHSGVVRVKPVVVSAIDAAFTLVARLAVYGSRVDVQFMQHDEQIRGDFAKLVAIEMSLAVMRFPKQYLQLGLRQYAAVDKQSIVQRLRTGYDVSLDPATSRLVARLRRVRTPAQALLEASERQREQLFYRG